MEKDKFTLRVDKEVLKKMKIVAVELEQPLNELLIEAFNAYYDDYIKFKENVEKQ